MQGWTMPSVTTVALVPLFLTVEAGGISSEFIGGGTTEAAMCKDFCNQQTPSAEGACKSFTRALPRPKMGRTCTKKFQEAFNIYCPLLCLAGGEEGHLSPRIERLTQSSCQDMSSHIPYPAVFNSCKTGYRNGFNAARTAVSKPFEQRGGLNTIDGNTGSPLEQSKNPESGTVYPGYHDVEMTELSGDTAFSRAAEVDAQPRQTESARTLEEDFEGWIESLDTPPEYIDYATVAQERVSAARRTRASDLQRGPACPVCSG